MRITVLILGLLLGALMFVQTFLVSSLSQVADDADSELAASSGLFMAFLWLVACAFVIPLPLVSVPLFLVAGCLGFLSAGDFSDLGVWGAISVALAVLSFFGWRGKRKADNARKVEAERQADRDRMLEEALLRRSP